MLLLFIGTEDGRAIKQTPTVTWLFQINTAIIPPQLKTRIQYKFFISTYPFVLQDIFSFLWPFIKGFFVCLFLVTHVVNILQNKYLFSKRKQYKCVQSGKTKGHPFIAIIYKNKVFTEIRSRYNIFYTCNLFVPVYNILNV